MANNSFLVEVTFNIVSRSKFEVKSISYIRTVRRWKIPEMGNIQ